MTALLLTLVGQLGVVAQTKIAVITDTHVIAPELLINKGTAWENEVKRAFKANGFEGTVHVRFGSRMKGIHLEYDLQVN